LFLPATLEVPGLDKETSLQKVGEKAAQESSAGTSVLGSPETKGGLLASVTLSRGLCTLPGTGVLAMQRERERKRERERERWKHRGP
jgi:hypothetical protein